MHSGGPRRPWGTGIPYRFRRGSSLNPLKALIYPAENYLRPRARRCISPLNTEAPEVESRAGKSQSGSTQMPPRPPRPEGASREKGGPDELRLPHHCHDDCIRYHHHDRALVAKPGAARSRPRLTARRELPRWRCAEHRPGVAAGVFAPATTGIGTAPQRDAGGPGGG